MILVTSFAESKDNISLVNLYREKLVFALV